MSTSETAPRSVLFLPANNPRAMAKARELPVDMVVLDLEDAVKPEDKEAARQAARDCPGFPGKLFGIRVNSRESDQHDDDLKAVRKSAATHVIVPKVEQPETVILASSSARRPALAMIETAAGAMNVGPIASVSGWGYSIAGLIAGTNDLAASLRLPPQAGRAAMTTALQLIVLAARGRDIWAIDGVFNRLSDPDGLAAECAEGRMLGFDGKSLIHPGQVDICHQAFAPTEAEIEGARQLIAAFTGGAQRHEDAMIEGMHVDRARAMLTRAGLTP
ncbi:HpcH/HpaI aldolase/citrate lyase family protein [Sphingomonas sp. FW199]|uniref:HpcH/HpaI aldolase/citrate lyase family protein n=1 Tax=Sphingomonas sp. FW199 TaxID=3400217 RepID=UPI003CFB4E5C